MDNLVNTPRGRANPGKRSALVAPSSNPLGIIVDLLPPGFPTRPGTRIRPTTLTIHNTDNANPGADASAHNRYIRSADAVARQVSWHFTVDDRDIYQHLPVNEKGWHAGAANSTSIGIEICMNRGMNEAAAYDRAARLCAFLGAQLGIPMPTGLRQHHDWTGKNCPSVLRGRPTGWRSFLNSVASHNSGARRNALPDISFTSQHPTGALGERAPNAVAEVLASIDHHFAEHADAIVAAAQALPIPAGDPIAFAASTAAITYWPVVTRHPRAMEVNTWLVGGGASGANASRRFLADRGGGARYHCAIDLYCSQGDPIVAVEDGKIVNFYHFYQNTYALLVQHDGYVINYGEVAPNSLSSLGLHVGDRINAGQRIGTVGRLNMLHFETYASGSTQNYSWPQTKQRPNRLRNPSQLLLDLTASAVRLDYDEAVTTRRAAAMDGASTLSAPSHAFVPASVPQMGTEGWHRFGSGTREWRYDERGLGIRDGAVVTQQRWEESLDTMRKIMENMGSELLAASAKHGIPPALLLMTVATETHIYKAHKFTGPKTFRWEAHVKNDDINPPTLGDYSAGPMQSLGTTARWVIRVKGAEYGLNYNANEVAPVYAAKPNPKPAVHPLYDYTTNLDLGAAEIRIRLHKSGLDPILVAAAFNAGGLYKSPHSPWGLRTYGDHLDRAAKWYGDACAYLIEIGVV